MGDYLTRHYYAWKGDMVPGKTVQIINAQRYSSIREKGLHVLLNCLGYHSDDLVITLHNGQGTHEVAIADEGIIHDFLQEAHAASPQDLEKIMVTLLMQDSAIAGLRLEGNESKSQVI